MNEKRPESLSWKIELDWESKQIKSCPNLHCKVLLNWIALLHHQLANEKHPKSRSWKIELDWEFIQIKSCLDWHRKSSIRETVSSWISCTWIDMGLKDFYGVGHLQHTYITKRFYNNFHFINWYDNIIVQHISPGTF